MGAEKRMMSGWADKKGVQKGRVVKRTVGLILAEKVVFNERVYGSQQVKQREPKLASHFEDTLNMVPNDSMSC